MPNDNTRLPDGCCCCCCKGWRCFKVLFICIILWCCWNVLKLSQENTLTTTTTTTTNSITSGSQLVDNLTLWKVASTTTKTTNKANKELEAAAASIVPEAVSEAVSEVTSAAIKSLSNDEWKSLLEVFQYMMMISLQPLRARDEDEWLPLVIRSNGQILCRNMHLQMLRKYQRFRLFVPMMYNALHYNASMAAGTAVPPFDKTATTTTTSKIHEIHIPPVNRTSIPLILAMGDMRNCMGQLFPRLSWSTVPDHEPCRSMAIPGYNLYLERPGNSPAKSFHAALEKKYPWSKKRKQAVWRGVATGHAPNGTWEWLPRAQLVKYSLQHPRWLDAGFISIKEFDAKYFKPTKKTNVRFVDHMKMEDYQKYRAIVDIDGNAWSARFGSLLCMNSVVIKIQAQNKNYFDDELKPWVHYIPVQSNMSNLLESIRFAVLDQNEKRVKSIIYNANEWCRTHLTQQRMVIYLFWKLNSYVELLLSGNDSKRWKQWDDLVQSLESRGILEVIDPYEFGFRNNTSWLYLPLDHPVPAPQRRQQQHRLNFLEKQPQQ